MEILVNPPRSDWERLCTRPSQADDNVRTRVSDILDRVRRGGDNAIIEIAHEIDGYTAPVTVSREEWDAAQPSGEVKKAIETAAANIRRFHEAQKPEELVVETMPGVRCMDTVGLYIPGGLAPLFSTVLMLAIPARIAGCRRIVLCTPANHTGKISREVLYAARYCGVNEVFRVGGAQAIAAMAYGTGSIPKVDKIFGPGNRWVTTAKQLVSTRNTAIDMPAGPSEVMVIADSKAPVPFVASDLLSQAEHGPDSQVVLLCESEHYADMVWEETQRQAAQLSRENFVEGSLSKSHFLVFGDVGKCIDFANRYAPEHLIICTRDPWKIADRITAAGSVFIGRFSPESAGDYASGTNHSLPTNGWARSYSGVGVESFMRRMTIQELSEDGLRSLSPTIIDMAEAEGLSAHANSVKVRLSHE